MLHNSYRLSNLEAHQQWVKIVVIGSYSLFVGQSWANCCLQEPRLESRRYMFFSLFWLASSFSKASLCTCTIETTRCLFFLLLLLLLFAKTKLRTQIAIKNENRNILKNFLNIFYCLNKKIFVFFILKSRIIHEIFEFYLYFSFA